MSCPPEQKPASSSSLASSPSRPGNFVIPYSLEADLARNIQAHDLIQFLNTQSEADTSVQALYNTDSSFFPRAYTDTDLIDTCVNNADKRGFDNGQKQETVDNGNCDVLTDQTRGEVSSVAQGIMAEGFGNGIGNNYKPDVVLSNSHQRVGPDGSPALAPTASGSQGFMVSNLSETGELFAPVRTLTFSDIDQSSSHIDDSYMNTSRFVSTPNKNDKKTNNYDYSGLQSGGFRVDTNHVGNYPEDQTDSSDSDNVLNGGRDESPEFRQLVGEADNEAANTGPFHPSAHGLSKEFMDQFVGKTGNQASMGENMDLFSPLGSNVFRVAERRTEVCTPPLHSPAPDSPYAKYAKGNSPMQQPRSPKVEAVQRYPRQDPDEIQFEMSPVRSHPDPRLFNREVVGYGGAGFSQNPPTSSSSYSTQGPYFTAAQNSVSLQQQAQVTRNIPKNLHEYFDHHDREQLHMASYPGFNHTTNLHSEIQRLTYDEPGNNDLESNDMDIESRQGDGSISDGCEGIVLHGNDRQGDGSNEGHFVRTASNSRQGDGAKSSSGSENRQGDGSDIDGDERSHQQAQGRIPVSTTDMAGKRIQQGQSSVDNHQHQLLQRTQVSVKLPQPTYDTISADTSHDDMYMPDTLPQNPAMIDCPPDIAMSGAVDAANAKDVLRPSPEKVMDLLQDQSGNPNTIPHFSETSGYPNSVPVNANLKTTGQQDTKLLASQSHNMLQSQHEMVIVGSKSLVTGTVNVPGQNLPFPDSHLGFIDTSSSTTYMHKSGIPSHQEEVGKPVSHQQAPPTHTAAGNQSQAPASSRLRQETVSQRNKTTHKYVSTVPKPASAVANKDTNAKKPIEVTHKNQGATSTATGSQGARKALSNDQKFKVSDKVKPKATSSENLAAQKSKSSIGYNQIKPTNENVVQSSRSANQVTQGHKVQGHRGHPHARNDLHLQSNRGVDRGQMNSVARDGSNLGHHGDQLQGHQRGQGQFRTQGHDIKGQGYDDSIEDGGEYNTRVVTQVQTTSPVRVEQSDQHAEAFKSTGDARAGIQGMEEVRQQLQSMMRFSQAQDQMSPQEKSQYEHSDIIAGFGVDMPDQAAKNVDMSWNFMRKSEDPGLENFQSFSSQYFTDSGNVSRSEASIHTENQRLRDMLEKERYRRKHCEQYIQQLNVRLLETQQQVAVAVSTDKRKDIMIEQLDKQLARVMEGWKRRDQEKDEMVEEAHRDKQQIQNKLAQQQQRIDNFENDMSDAVEALRQEKENAAQNISALKEQLQESDRAKAHVAEVLEAEREKGQLLEQESSSLREGRESLDKKLDQMQRRLHREQDDWFQREQELLQRIEEVSENNTKILQLERTKFEEQSKLADEIMEQYQTATTQVKKYELELDAALREKESVKVEMGIMEAKFENTQRVLEADLHATMERQIAQQITDVQTRHERKLEDMGEKHRQQMLELSQRNGKEMEKQLSVFREEMLRKEEEYRSQCQDLETRLSELRVENAELRRSKQKLESTRMEILTKLQYAMQSQWNEALSLLTATPQRKNTQSRTGSRETDGMGSLAMQSAPAVNFSLYSPSKPSANQQSSCNAPTNQQPSLNAPSTPPRHQQPIGNNETSTSPQLANHLSPILRHSANQDGYNDHVSTNNSADDSYGANIETAALTHLKQFQDYMSSLTKTPDWISSFTGQLDSSAASTGAQKDAQGATGSATGSLEMPRLPSPPVIAALLSTHLRNIQQQQLVPHPTENMTHPPDTRTHPPDTRPHPPDAWTHPPDTRPHPPDAWTHPPDTRPHPSETRTHLPETRPHPPDTWAHPPDMRPHPPDTRLLPHVISNQSAASHNDTGYSLSQPSSMLSSHTVLPHDNTQNSTSLPTNISSGFNSAPVNHPVTPPRRTNVTNQMEAINYANLNQTDSTVYSEATNHSPDMSSLWGGAAGMSQAVPIRPPQQSDDPYLIGKDQSMLSAISSIVPVGGYFQGGQSFSPPTKQQKDNETNSVEDLTNQTNRLTDDYSMISEKLERHEFHQNELQHYIQMLLHRSPGDVDANNSQNDSTMDELDLNDTAQAAQLQKELDRIQELRRKQEASNQNKSGADNQAQACKPDESATTNRILSEEQLAEVNRLLRQVKGQESPGEARPNAAAVNKLLEMLKQAQGEGNPSRAEAKRGQKPQSPRNPSGHHGDRHRAGPTAPGIRRNVQFNPGKGAEGVKHNSGEAGKQEKATPKQGQSSQTKKMDRKVAGGGSAVKEKENKKFAAWK